MLKLLLFLFLLAVASIAQAQSQVDVVVYGGTASGVITAYSAARERLHVQLIEPPHTLAHGQRSLSAINLGEFRMTSPPLRTFPAAMAVSLQFRLEAFTVLNKVQFGLLNITVGSSTFGTIHHRPTYRATLRQH